MNAKKLYFSFNGRIGRKQYWINYVLLFSISITVIALALTLAAGATQNPLIALLNIPVGIVAVWGTLAVTVKRFHDRDKKGWWVLIGLVPVVGSLWLLIENGFLRGTDGPNRFGDDPLDIDEGSSPKSDATAAKKRQPMPAKSAADGAAAKDAARGLASTDLLLIGMMVLGALILAWALTSLV